MRTIAVALALLALAAAPALAANSFTVFGTNVPVATQGIQQQTTGYYPDTLVVLAGDTIVFDSLHPLDVIHPPLVLKGPEGAQEIVGPDEEAYDKVTTYSDLQPGHYTFQCIFHAEMTGTFDVV